MSYLDAIIRVHAYLKDITGQHTYGDTTRFPSVHTKVDSDVIAKLLLAGAFSEEDEYTRRLYVTWSEDAELVAIIVKLRTEKISLDVGTYVFQISSHILEKEGLL